VFSKVFASPMKAGFYGGDAGAESDGNFGMTAAFLDEGKEGAVLRAELGKSMAEGVEFLRIDRASRLRDVFVLRGERREDPTQFLAAEMVNAGVTREAKEPRLELRGRLQTIERSNHFDENELSDILDRVTSSDDGIDKPSHAVLISHDELALGVGLTALRAADKFDRKGRLV
jgi:hypothetical protein